jgi:hypothetical protein
MVQIKNKNRKKKREYEESITYQAYLLAAFTVKLNYKTCFDFLSISLSIYIYIFILFVLAYWISSIFILFFFIEKENL